MKRFGLSEKTCQTIINILKHYSVVESAVLYGSRAIGNYREGSDIDLTLKGQDIDLQTLNKISDELDDSFLPYKFDLSVYHTLEQDDIKDHIKRVGILFYKRASLLSDDKETL